MPYKVKSTGKYQASRYGRRRAPRKAGPSYGFIPLTALVIFAAVVLVSHTGLGDRLEQAVAAAAQSSRFSESIVRLILPESHNFGDAPPPDIEAAISPSGVTSPAGDEPLVLHRDADDEAVHDDIYLSDEDIGLYLPEPLAFESVMPELEAAGVEAPSNVASLTISGAEGGYQGSGTVYMRNETQYDIDVASLLGKKNPVKLSGDGVQVLIMHTHGTEAYTPDSVHQYVATDPDRTTDNTRNMIRVGDEIEQILTQNGINVIHSTTLNDYPAYNGSYTRALEDITKYIKENPSIKVVIDVHRDSMESKNGTKYKTVASIDGRDAAQLMFVTGTDEGGLSHSNWRQNLAFQMQIQDRMNTRYPGIMRPINVRTGRFNQHVTTGSMLLEVGTSGNSLSEALLSAQLFAQELADMLNGN